jgi:hypothetical protein
VGVNDAYGGLFRVIPRWGMRRRSDFGSPWKTVDHVGLATIGWVHWHTTQSLHGDLPTAMYHPPS